MSNKSTALLRTISVLLSALVMSGCAQSPIKIGWMENSNRSHKTARYTTFSGAQQTEICADPEGTISLDYKVTVDQGTLTAALNEPDGTPYWQNTFRQGADGTLSAPAPEEGCYTLRLSGEATGGGFDFAWKITN